MSRRWCHDRAVVHNPWARPPKGSADTTQRMQDDQHNLTDFICIKSSFLFYPSLRLNFPKNVIRGQNLPSKNDESDFFWGHDFVAVSHFNPCGHEYVLTSHRAVCAATHEPHQIYWLSNSSLLTVRLPFAIVLVGRWTAKMSGENIE